MVDIDAVIERALTRDRAIVLTAITVVIVLSWVYVLAGAGMSMSAIEMTRVNLSTGETGSMTHGISGDAGEAMSTVDMGGMAMMTPAVWTLGYAGLMFLMWWIMMIAMMLPSASPTILLFAAINRKQRERGNHYVSISIFAFAYLIVWGSFSLAAVALQWGFERMTWLSPMLVTNSAVLGGGLLLVAGIYQLTPIKQACLKHCRSPVHFISSHWRRGSHGAFIMGLQHGAFCVGCCWFLMGLLFFGGVMNLYWIAGLALFVLLEKSIPAGHWLSYAAGVALIAWGATVLVSG